MAKLFISYSHADEALRNELEKQLAMLKREGAIEVWHDRRIPAGDAIDHAIDAELQTADVILLLVSPDFLHSSYCYDVEVAAAMQRHNSRTARVIPVILRHCDWQSSVVPFRGLLAVPQDGKPVASWPDRDEAMLNIVRGIRAALPKAKPQPRADAAELVTPAAAAWTAQHPRSSNMRVAKIFTRADLDSFLDEAFEYLAKFFDGSLSELANRNTDIRVRFRRIDADSFGCTVYRNGDAAARCGVRRGGGFGNGITYSTDDNAPSRTMNEQLTPEYDDQAIWLRAMGMQHHPGVESWPRDSAR